MAKIKNEIKLFSTPDYPPPYYPGKIFYQDEVPIGRSEMVKDSKDSAGNPVKIFIVPPRVSIRDLLSQCALDIAIVLTTVACALWLAGYCYLRVVP